MASSCTQEVIHGQNSWECSFSVPRIWKMPLNPPEHLLANVLFLDCLVISSTVVPAPWYMSRRTSYNNRHQESGVVPKAVTIALGTAMLRQRHCCQVWGHPQLHSEFWASQATVLRLCLKHLQGEERGGGRNISPNLLRTFVPCESRLERNANRDEVEA